MRINYVRDETGRAVGVAWRLLGRTGYKLGKRAQEVENSACACGEEVCDCGCDCDV